MKFAKVKQGTEAWALINNIFTYKDKWAENEPQINEFLGFPMDNNIAFEVNNLWIRPETLEKYRPEWVNEFKKNESPTPAKSKSKVKKAWLELCKKLGLETYKMRDFTWKYGIIMMGATEAHKYNEVYIISVDNDKFDFSAHDWAEPMAESAFLRIRADHLEKTA